MSGTLLRAPNSQPNGDITLRDLLAPLFRHKRTVCGTFLLASLLAVAAAVQLSGSYESHMKVLVNRERLDPVVSSESETQLLGAAITPPSPEEINSEAELLQSGDVLEKVVLQNGLQESEKKSLWARLHPHATDEQFVSRAVRHLDKQLKIEPVIKTNLISVRYKSSNPQIAYAVMNALATFYVEKHVAVHHPTGAYDFFAKQADKYRTALADSEARLASLIKQEGSAPGLERTDMALVVANTAGLLQQTEQVAASDVQRIAADNEQMQTTPARSTTQRSSIAANLLLQQLEANLLAAQNKRAQLLVKFDPSYPLVQEADEEIAGTQAAIAEAQKTQYVDETTDRDPTFELLREDLAKAKSDLAAQRAGAQELKLGIHVMQSQMVDLDQKNLKQADLNREIKANEDNYLLYLAKQEQALASDALNRKKIANVTIAVPPTIPVLPSVSALLALAVGFPVAFGLSIGAGYAAEYLDSSLCTPAQVTELLGIPVVIAIPRQAAASNGNRGLLETQS
jgi:polysaccharide biosynthesis transport protein